MDTACELLPPPVLQAVRLTAAAPAQTSAAMRVLTLRLPREVGAVAMAGSSSFRTYEAQQFLPVRLRGELSGSGWAARPVRGPASPRAAAENRAGAMRWVPRFRPDEFSFGHPGRGRNSACGPGCLLVANAMTTDQRRS